MDAPTHTIDALLLDIDAISARDREGELRARIAQLIAAGVGVGLLTRLSVGELDGTLDGLRLGPGPVLLAVESGAQLYRVDGHRLQLRRSGPAADAGAGWQLLAEEFVALGVPRGGVLLLGPELPSMELLEAQLRLRALKRVPRINEATTWTVTDDGPSASEVQPAVFTIGDGTIVTRGVAEEEPAGDAVLAAGVYLGTGPQQHPRPGPGWTALKITGPHAAERRVLDLRGGVLLREELAGDHPLRTFRFASIVRPGVQALRAEGGTDRLAAGAPLQPPAEGAAEAGSIGEVSWARTVGDVGGIVAAAVQDVVEDDGHRAVDRLVAYRADPREVPSLDAATDALADAARLGFDALLAENRQAWARRWASVDVEIPDDPAAEQAFRFALFQLWVNVGCPVEESGAWNGQERAVGARGLSGQGYSGHVFWDADIFGLPALATICPAAARAMVEYRIRRLPAARARATAFGHAGARFPWESARDGDEVTPSTAMLGDTVIPILTGELEEHIVSDVAWAADRYATWTGDLDVLAGPARPLIVETARYWASRITRGEDGKGHINDVIGPDEYHEGVDDNAFTNIMARWNLRRGADLNPDAEEAQRWRELADAVVDGYDHATGRHEQFAGYNDLEPLLVAGIAPLPFPADLLLGRQKVWGSQLIKQADVLMAHFLVPDDLPAGSLVADLDFYVPRTSHGSSLSPAITAGLLARAGRPDEGLETLRMALRLDLDDLTGSSTGGVHLATIGGTWAALVDGFVGLTVRDSVLYLDPQLPSEWRTLRVRLHVLGARISVEITADRLTVSTDRPLRVCPAGSSIVEVSDTASFDR